jgi:hypothetical protein
LGLMSVDEAAQVRAVFPEIAWPSARDEQPA